MKWIAIISMVLSFSAIVMVDTDKTPLWVVALLLIWFVASAMAIKKSLLAELKEIQ